MQARNIAIPAEQVPSIRDRTTRVDVTRNAGNSGGAAAAYATGGAASTGACASDTSKSAVCDWSLKALFVAE